MEIRGFQYRMQKAGFMTRYLFLFAVFFLGGCSVPRTGELFVLGALNSPAPLHSKQVHYKIDAAPWGLVPGVEYAYRSSLSPRDALTFYQKALAAKGWLPMREPGFSILRNNATNIQQNFVNGDYRFWLAIDGIRTSEDQQHSTIEFRIEPYHVWDGSRYPRDFFYWADLRWVACWL